MPVGNKRQTANLYHYTVGQHIIKIIEQGAILPATVGLPKGERPIVWFSSSPTWDETCNKGAVQNGQPILLTREQTAAEYGGLFRVIVLPDVAPYSWQRLRFLSKMHPAIADKLEETARAVGSNSDEWFGTFKSVTRDKWTAIETLVDEGWVSYDLPKSVAAESRLTRE